MAPILNSNVFKCIMPLGLSEIMNDLANNMKYGIYQIGNKAFLSVYQMNKDTSQGYLAENDQCNLQLINEASQTKNTPLEVMFNGCKDKNAIYEIADLIVNSGNKHNIILKQAVTPNQNGTANIFGQLYKVTDYMLSQGNITETNGADFLGLNKCTKEEAISALQSYSTYKKQLTSIETLTNILQDTLDHLGISQDNAQEAGVEIFNKLKIPVKFTTDNLRVILKAFKLTLDNAQEAGVKIFDVLNIPVKFTTDNLKIILEAFKLTLDNAQEAGVKIFDVLNIPVKFTTDNLKIILEAFKLTLDNAQEAGVKIFDVLNIPVKFTTDNLKIILEAFNVTLDDISPTEIGKNILDLLSKPFTEATTSTTEKPNDDTNGGGTWGYVIGAVGFIAASLMAAKYVWDLRKGKNIKDGNLGLEGENIKLEGENIKLEGENIKLQKDNINLSTLIEFQAILDEIIEIGNLTDILAILSKTNQDTINLHGQDYDISLLKSKIQGLDKAIIKLNSVSSICTNINSLGNTLHKICDLLNGKDTFIAIKSFANLIKESRETDIKSEERKNCLEKIFETLLRIDETSSGEYTYIPEEGLQNHGTPLLAAESSDSSGIGV